MYYGELSKHSYEYQCGHETGSIRAYDDAIQWFEKIKANEKKNTKHTTDEFISMLKYCKRLWLEFCDTYGMGKDPDDDECLTDDSYVDIFADEYSEALYAFVSKDDIYADYCEVSLREYSMLENLSFAEYVNKYRYNEFKQYLFDNGLITEEQLFND